MLICSTEVSLSVIFLWILFSVGSFFRTACFLLDLLKDNIDLVSFTLSNNLFFLKPALACAWGCVCVCMWDKLLSKTHFLLLLMTGIITIIFPGILEVLCPTGMSCLPRFQPRLESLHELWDLNLFVFCLLHTRFCWMPMRVTGPLVLNLTAP